MVSHTDTPWEVRVEQITPTSNETCYTVATDEYDIVSPILGIRREEDARHIVHCVNNMPKVVEMLTKLLAHPENGWTRHKAHALLSDMDDELEGNK